LLFQHQQLLKNPEVTQEQATKCLQMIERARSNGADKDVYWAPLSLKFKGMAHETLGDLPAALQAYDLALGLNPKIGVKRKADSLRKGLDPNSQQSATASEFYCRAKELFI
jgi:hypothetical protein